MQQEEPDGAAEAVRGIPTAVIARLPELLRVLDGAARRGIHTLSSDDLAGGIDTSSAMIRKDLSLLGFTGTRGVGYDVADLRAQVASALGLAASRPVALVGVGHLGRALMAYPGFVEQGFRIAAAFDADPRIVGIRIAAAGIEAGLEVHDAALLEQVLGDLDIRMAILTLPAASAQSIADRLVAAGVVSLLNFAPVALSIPPHVEVRRTDLAAELQVLAFHARRAPAPTGALA